MTTPAARPYPTMAPPPTQRLAVAYFTPLMDPLPVGTRIPQPAPGEMTIDYFLRVEAGGGTQVNDRLMWRVGVILHSYCPNNDETVGEENLQTALAWGANAMGTSIALSNGEQWYVSSSSARKVIQKFSDELTNLTRFRGSVLWLMPGKQIHPTTRGVVGTKRRAGTPRKGVHNVNTPPAPPAGRRAPTPDVSG